MLRDARDLHVEVEIRPPPKLAAPEIGAALR
jgi:hypothetical protein